MLGAGGGIRTSGPRRTKSRPGRRARMGRACLATAGRAAAVRQALASRGGRTWIAGHRREDPRPAQSIQRAARADLVRRGALERQHAEVVARERPLDDPADVRRRVDLQSGLGRAAGRVA